MDIIFEISDLKIKCKALNNKTAEKLIKLMPIEAKIATWGNEIYFDVFERLVKYKLTILGSGGKNLRL